VDHLTALNAQLSVATGTSDGNVHPRAGEFDGDVAPDPAPAAGDERYPASEVLAVRRGGILES
jgi:hypothetical protein